MKLKMTSADIDALRAKLAPVVAANPNLYKEYQAQGLSDMRYNWDIARVAKVDICAYYTYLDDTHINSALAHVLGNSGKAKSKHVEAGPNGPRLLASPPEVHLDDAFLAKVRGPIVQTWGHINADVEGDISNKGALELVLDANRMSYSGYDEADKLVNVAVKQYGYPWVERFLAKHIKLV